MKTFFLLLSIGIAVAFSPADQAVSFTLRNNSLQSIPLKIPGVMNPNLSPMSDSGVSLEVGQKIFFKHNGKKRLLLTVTEDLDGEVVIVNQLLRKRKKELGL